MDGAEERTSEFEGRMREMTQSEQQREHGLRLKKKKKLCRASGICGIITTTTTKTTEFHIMSLKSQKERRKQAALKKVLE